MQRTALRAALCVTALAAAAGASSGTAVAKTDYAAPNLAFNVLTPGETGSLIPDAFSVDQGKMYDALTPLRGNVSLANVQSGLYYKPETFQAPAIADANAPAKPGCYHPPAKTNITICRDSHSVPHVTVTSRADGAFAMGYLAAQDRGLLINYGRGPGYVSALSAPGINAFGLIQQARSFTPSAAAKKFMTDQINAFKNASSTNKAVYDDFAQWVKGVMARINQTGSADEKAALITNPWTVEDAFAAFSFIGSIFGNGGGNEGANSGFLAKLQAQFGVSEGLKIFRDFRHSNDLDAPVSWKDSTFTYNAQPTNTTNTAVPGSKVIDVGSEQNTFSRVVGSTPGEPRKRYMSNALLVPASRSASGNPLAVMGPQLGYFYPEIVMEVDIHGGGYDTRGAVAPVAPYMLIGRGKDYSWSLTSASSDNSDQFLEKLCVPGGGTPTRSTKYYEYKGACKAMTLFNAGTLGAKGASPAQDLTFYETVHGPVSGTVTVGGAPYAVSNARANRGREPYSALALADLTLNKVTSSSTFFKTANKFDTTFNWHYVDSKNICFFSSGRLPIRASGIDSSLPTLGTGAYDWKGFISQNAHPHGCNPKAVTGDNASALITNWNNHPSKGWGAADDEWSYGSTHRMDLFQRLFRTTRTAGKTLKLNDVVGVMNQAATEDSAAVDVWPAIEKVLMQGRTYNGSSSTQESALYADITSAGQAQGASLRAAALAGELARWVKFRDARRADDNADGNFDDFGPAAWDVTWPKIADAVVQGRLTEDLKNALWGVSGGRGDKTYQGTGVPFVNKDLRTLTGQTFKSPYSRIYCGAGNLAACRTAIWTAFDVAAGALETASGSIDNEDWINFSGHTAAGNRIHFGPLYPNDPATGQEFTMRWTNRPTFQQAISFSSHR